MRDQKVVTLNFQPGIVKEQSQKVAEPYWTNGDKIRFRNGKPEIIGGWLQTTLPSNLARVYGTPRLLETLRPLSGQPAAVLATHKGVYSTDLETYNNITPVYAVVSLMNNFSTVAGSNQVVVSISAHGITTGTLVVFLSAHTTIGGNIALATTPASSPIYEVVSAAPHHFVILANVSAAATSASTGGGAVAILYYPAGNESVQLASGWGTGTWSGPFGWSSPGGGVLTPSRQWSMDYWGTNMVAVPTSGPLFYWDTLSNITTPMVLVTAAPSVNNFVRVESEARHVILYGTHPIGGTFDPLLVRWSDRENYAEWTPTATNRAGDFRLNSTGSRIVTAVKTADKYLVLTDADAFVQNFIGGNDVFGFMLAGRNCGAISQNCAIEFRGTVYWMSTARQFFQYNGRIESIPCTVLRYVFDDINLTYQDRIIAGTIAQHNEIIWFYPSKNSTGENDKYVIYNVAEQHWSIGTLTRTAWKDRGVFNFPLAAGVSGQGLFYHETGYQANGQPLSAFVESGYVDLESGNDIIFMNKIIPDVVQPDGSPINTKINMEVSYRKYPGGPIITKGPFVVSAATEKIYTRVRGREISLRLSSSETTNSAWRLGELRVAVQPDGLR